MYAMRLMFARSVAEVPSVRAANLYEFPFGFNYGWMLLIFALTGKKKKCFENQFHEKNLKFLF